MKNLPLIVFGIGPLLIAGALGGCSSDDDDDTAGTSGKGGSAGSSAGKGGSAGKSGSTAGGKGGKGSAGSSTTGGSSGEGGAATGGTAGVGNEAGATAEAGTGTGGSGGSGATGESGATSEGGSGGGTDADCSVPSLTGIPTVNISTHSGAYPTPDPMGGTIATGTYAKTKEDVYAGGIATVNTKEVLVFDATAHQFQSAADAASASAGTYAINDVQLSLILACGQTGTVSLPFEVVTGGFKTYDDGKARVDTWTKQ